jgi:hypothetical protein
MVGGRADDDLESEGPSRPWVGGVGGVPAGIGRNAKDGWGGAGRGGMNPGGASGVPGIVRRERPSMFNQNNRRGGGNASSPTGRR